MEGAPTTSAVCTDGAAARLLCAGRVAQVLLGSDGGKLGALVAALRAAGPGRVAVFAGHPADAADQAAVFRAAGPGRGRVAVFVGDPADEADRAAALAMAQEQFGGTPVLVSSPAQARALLKSPDAYRASATRPGGITP